MGMRFGLSTAGVLSHHSGRPSNLFGLLLIIAAVCGACGGVSPPKAATSPPQHPTPTASPSQAEQAGATPAISPVGSFGVLVTSGLTNTYTVTLVGTDGKVVGSAQASSPPVITCGFDATPAVLPPPISTGNTRVYYVDAAGVVRFLTPTGSTGPATTVPTGDKRRSGFTVSPNDHPNCGSGERLQRQRRCEQTLR